MIVTMKTLNLIGMAEEKDNILSSLAKLGCVDISESPPGFSLGGEDDGGLTSQVERDLPSERLGPLLEELSLLQEAIALETPYDSRKKGLLKGRRQVDREAFLEAYQSRDAALACAKKSVGTWETLQKVQTERQQLKTLWEGLAPYEDLNIPFSKMRTKYTDGFIGTIPGDADFDGLVGEMLVEIGAAQLQTLSVAKEYRCLFVLCHIDVEHDLQKLLKKYGFSQTVFKGISGLPRDEIRAAQDKDVKLAEEETALYDQLREDASALDLLELTYDSLSAEAQKEKMKERLGRTGSTFCLSGYLPEGAVPFFEAYMKDFCVAFELGDPVEEDENVPILLKNGPLVAPYEVITSLYSLPTYRGLDPDAVMAPFFCLFFGMMLSDAGYGLIITFACAFLLWKGKLRPGLKKAIQLGLQCGISTTVMGFVFGSFFGDLIPVIQGMATGVQGEMFALVNPMKEPMTVLIISMLLGVIHLFVGIGTKMYMLFRDGEWFAALADQGSWIVIITGCGLLFLGGVAGKIGLWMVIAGAAVLVLTQGRDKKNIIMKFFSGILSLYDVTGYLSDILSYSRLLALGLATAVISSVINTMGALGGGTVGGFITLFLVGIVGHTLNIAINALGAYVHSSRLQYVEFFGKFYESGGRAFAPFATAPNYVDIELKEDN